MRGSGEPRDPRLVVLPFGEAPATRHVRGSNYVHVGVIPDRRPDRVVVFQEAGLMPWMTVQSNIEYGLKLQGLDKQVRRERAEQPLCRNLPCRKLD